MQCKQQTNERNSYHLSERTHALRPPCATSVKPPKPCFQNVYCNFLNLLINMIALCFWVNQLLIALIRCRLNDFDEDNDELACPGSFCSVSLL